MQFGTGRYAETLQLPAQRRRLWSMKNFRTAPIQCLFQRAAPGYAPLSRRNKVVGITRTSAVNVEEMGLHAGKAASDRKPAPVGSSDVATVTSTCCGYVGSAVSPEQDMSQEAYDVPAVGQGNAIGPTKDDGRNDGRKTEGNGMIPSVTRLHPHVSQAGRPKGQT